MSKRFTNYKNKVINEINELYPDVVGRYNHKNKGVEIWGGIKNINKNSKLKNLKKLNDFVGDIIKIEDIIIRRPVEDDIFTDEYKRVSVPYCVYECAIVKSIKENKYYTLDIEFITEKEINKIESIKKPIFYIFDITNNSYKFKDDEDIDYDVDYNECYELLKYNYQNALSIKDIDNSYYFK